MFCIVYHSPFFVLFPVALACTLWWTLLLFSIDRFLYMFVNNVLFIICLMNYGTILYVRPHTRSYTAMCWMPVVVAVYYK